MPLLNVPRTPSFRRFSCTSFRKYSGIGKGIPTTVLQRYEVFHGCNQPDKVILNHSLDLL